MSGIRHRIIELHVYSDVGWRRRRNQDNYLAGDAVNAAMADISEAGAEVRPLNEDPVRIRAAAVFDGMGGETDGELAARTAAEEIRACAEGLEEGTGWEEAVSRMRAAMEEAGRKIREPAAPGTTRGTTATILLTDGRYGKILHVGDSRAYRWRDGRLEQLTKDQTEASLWEEKMKTPAPPAMASRLLVFLGTGTGKRELDILETDLFPWEEDDRFLLCSDGLYRACSREEMEALMKGDHAGEICRSLVEAALGRDGSDNVTAMVLMERKEEEET